jgi:hypothetical protein
MRINARRYIGPFTKKYRDELIGKQWMPFLAKQVPLVVRNAPQIQ